MKFNVPQQGDFRTVKKFALFPIEINDVGVWLETVYIKQYYKKYYGWKNFSFVKEENYDANA